MAQAVDTIKVIYDRNSGVTQTQDFPVPLDQEAMIERFRSAIRRAGGNLVVAQRSGIPKGTINNLLRGTDVRISNAYAIAVACDVSLDWLATGRGDNVAHDLPKSEASQQADVTPHDPAKRTSLFSNLNMDQFALCLELVQTAFVRMKQDPDPRRVAQLTSLLYDAMQDGTFATSDLNELFAANKK
jgi:hypothetical protein